MLMMVSIRNINTATLPYSCREDGYFRISPGEDQRTYCPNTNPFCDYVLCSWYPAHSTFIRVFYRCPQEESGANFDYVFNEVSQNCETTVNPVSKIVAFILSMTLPKGVMQGWFKKIKSLGICMQFCDELGCQPNFINCNILHQRTPTGQPPDRSNQT